MLNTACMATMVILKCECCNCEFTIKKGKERKFCSIECKRKNREIIDSVYYVEKICEHCGLFFKSKKKEKLRFCSRICADSHKVQINRENRICEVCGTMFIEKKSRKRRFCSEECRKSFQTRPENIRYRMDRTSLAVREKYGVDNTFQVESIRLLANDESRKVYKIRGREIMKSNMLIFEKNRQLLLNKRLVDIGYKILEFNETGIRIQHPDGHIFEENRKFILNRLNHGVELSTLIQPVGSPRTTFEFKLCNFMISNNIKHISNDRKTIKGELDIYLPEHKLAIEINGLHWHSEIYLNDDYHLDKTIKCEVLGIDLLHFFEDELLEKYDIVESIIKNKLDIINDNISSDCCNVVEIDNKTTKEFLIKNHILGHINSSINLGLVYNEMLVSVMTFSGNRNIFNSNNKNDGEYEMLRYSNKLDLNIIGGDVKLFKYFKSEYSPTKITYFDDRRYLNKNISDNLGFKFVETIRPNYWYVVGKKRKHKFLFRKSVLVENGYDPNKSEHEIMVERKIPRIYDCGKLKYIYVNK